MIRRSRIRGAVVLGATLLVVVVAATSDDDTRIPIGTAAADQRDLLATVSAIGRVQARAKSDVSAEVTGRVTELAVREGDDVVVGQFLVQIDTTFHVATLRRAEQALRAARTRLDEAHVDLERATRRAAATVTAPGSADSADPTVLRGPRGAVESARQALEQSQTSLKEARANMGKTRISAPISGRVTRLRASLGEMVMNSSFNREQGVVLTINDLNAFDVRARVHEADVRRVHVGDSAAITLDAYTDTTVAGRVESVSLTPTIVGMPGAPDAAAFYDVVIRIVRAPPDTRPGFSASAAIVTDRRTGALAVPVQALATRPHGRQRDVDGVFVVGRDRRVHFRPVETGIVTDEFVEVRSGLRIGEQVAVGPHASIRRLTDGATTRPVTRRDRTADEEERVP